MPKKITIVTGASSNHFSCLRNLLWTIAQHEPSAKVIAWDLGLDADQRAELLDVPPFYLADWSLPLFEFSKYPPHFNMSANGGFIAFRPVTLEMAADQYGGVVVWLDAGNQLYGRLDNVVAAIERNGLYVHTSAGQIEKSMFRSALDKLAPAAEVLKSPIREPGICGFDSNRPEVAAFLHRWSQVAQNKDCTAPDGATLRTNWPDAVFTILLAQSAQAGKWNLKDTPPANILMRCDNVTFGEMQRHITH